MHTSAAAAPAPFGIDCHEAPGAHVVSIRGELDQSVVAEAEAQIALTALDDHGLVFDLTRCEFIDSAGLAALMRTTRDCRRLDLSAIAAPSGTPVRRLLDLTGLTTAFPTFERLEDAVDRVTSVYEWRHAPVL